MSDGPFDLGPRRLSPYGGFWRRVGAALLDVLLLLIPLALLAWLFGDDYFVRMRGAPGGHSVQLLIPEAQAQMGMPHQGFRYAVQSNPLVTALQLALFLAYKVALESGPGAATLGKRAFGLKVLRADGSRLSPLQSLLRAYPFWLPSLGGLMTGVIGWAALDNLTELVALLSCVAVAFTPRKQGLHDVLVQAYVVRAGATPVAAR